MATSALHSNFPVVVNDIHGESARFGGENWKVFMISSKRNSLLTQSYAVALFAQAVSVCSASAQSYDQTINANQSSMVLLAKPGTTVLVAPGAEISVASSLGFGDADGIQGAPGDTWILTNQGSVEAHSDGISLDGPGSGVINHGQISGRVGIWSKSDLFVRNEAGGRISGKNAGVQTYGPLTLDNAGSIISEFAAVEGHQWSGRFGADVRNTGTLQGRQVGIGLLGNSDPGSTNTIRNFDGGQILATDAISVGLYAELGSSTVTNGRGSIIKAGLHGIHGANLSTEILLNNWGAIEGTNGLGVWTYGGGMITNFEDGVISGLGGVSYTRSRYGDVDLTNDGTITATGTTFIGGDGLEAGVGAGVYVGAAAAGGSIRNLAGGIIQGGAYGIYSGSALEPDDAPAMSIVNAGTIQGDTGISVNDAPAFITNSGTIAGSGGVAIRFDQTRASSNSLTLDTGSVLHGKVLGGAGSDSLLLLGSGIEDGGKFQNFETLNINGAAWRLTGDSSFSQSSNVTAGRLTVNGTLSSPSVSVKAGTILGGGGTINGNVSNLGTIAPGAEGEVGTLTVNGDLVLASSSALNFQLGRPRLVGQPPDEEGSSALNDLVNVSGDLTLDGVLNVSSTTGSAFGAGIYRLINYGGTLTDNGLALGAMPAGSSNSIQTSVAGQVNLINASGPALRFWDGDAGSKFNSVIDGGNGIWHASGGNDNWTEKTGALNGAFSDGAYAVFSGAAGTVTVDNTHGPVMVGGMQFATSGYRIQGGAVTLLSGETPIRVGDGSASGANFAAKIASPLVGDGMLVKADGGTLVLSGANNHTGGTSIEGGTLQISADANLGAAGGKLAFDFDGGVLHTTSSFGMSRPVALNTTGFFDVDGGTTLDLAGPVSGASDLMKLGGGALALTGANAYRNTGVLAGTLIGDSNSISGSIGNAGIAIFDQSTSGTFAGNIAGLSQTQGVMVKRGGGTLRLSGNSALDWTVDDGKLISSAERFDGNVHLRGGTMTFDQDVNASYAGLISGSGTLEKAGRAALLLLEDNVAFSGLTAVNAGTLYVNGTLGGSVAVASGGTLGGAGTAGSTTIEAGGVLSPGQPLLSKDSIGGETLGTLAVSGDLTFKSGSTFSVDISPSASDRVNVSGSATIEGGNVAVEKIGGVYVPGSRWTILNASGAVSGAFGSISENLPYVGLMLEYDPNNVYLHIQRNDIAFCLPGFNHNQCAIANGVESLGQGDALYDNVASQTDGKAAAYAFDQLSGEIHASAKAAILDDSGFIRGAMNERLRYAFGAVGTAGTPAAGGAGTAGSAAHGERAAVWAQGFGAWGHVDGDGNAARMSRSIGGIFIGADGAVSDHWRVGALGGYSETDLRVGGRSSSADSDNYHLGAYAGAQRNNLSFRSGVALTWHRLSTKRSAVFPGFQDHLSADYSARTTQVFGEFGYRFDLGRTALGAAALEPFVNLAYVNLDTDGFTERGGIARLSSRSANDSVTYTTLGLRGQTTHTFDNGVSVLARGALGWRHAFGDVRPDSNFAFAGGSAFDILGTPIAKNALQLEAGFDAKVSKTMILGLSYMGQIANLQQEHGLKANMSWRF